MSIIKFIALCCNLFSTVNCDGLLLLYRPRDITHDCAFSTRLRYDISFGMGMSDTITLVLRTLSDVNYHCGVEIVSEDRMVIIVVIKYPNKIGDNCAANRDAIIVMKKDKCLRLCDSIEERDISSPYFVFMVQGKVRIRFLSNSSINSDMNANMYQITATSARKKPRRGCIQRNETYCAVHNEEFCFSSGVVCDGINNCGVIDWFDERKSECSLPVEKLGLAPVIAVMASMLCLALIAGHILLRCLPPLANSFFIFNANEDNRLCIDPVLKSPGVAMHIERAKNTSLIPVSSSSSDTPVMGSSILEEPSDATEVKQEQVSSRKNTMRTMAEKLHNKFRSASVSDKHKV